MGEIEKKNEENLKKKIWKDAMKHEKCKMHPQMLCGFKKIKSIINPCNRCGFLPSTINYTTIKSIES